LRQGFASLKGKQFKRFCILSSNWKYNGGNSMKKSVDRFAGQVYFEIAGRFGSLKSSQTCEFWQQALVPAFRFSSISSLSTFVCTSPQVAENRAV